MGLTQEVAHFVARTRYRDIPKEIVQLARGFILDGLGVALAGSTDECSRIVQAQVRQMSGKGESSIVGTALAAPAAKAALANGVAGHAMDYDDTQLSTSKEAVYGLLTHPTTPVLAALLAVGEKEKITGEEFVLAYLLAVEVECRIADAINPRHYQDGFHSTATMGGLGAAMAVGKILRLKEPELITTLGVIRRSIYFGDAIDYSVELSSGKVFRVIAPPSQRLEPGQAISAAAHPQHCVVVRED
ncbi:MAG: TOBE domain-containing protein [Deltaproteobacteria bacterium]|nr:TOBE domain-containing protein [Deltaproteobacteria bacterium]